MDTKIFIQYSCQLSEKHLNLNKRIGALSGCITVLGVLILLAINRYRKLLIVKEAEIWDLETITADDFSSEIQLSKKICKSILNRKA